MLKAGWIGRLPNEKLLEKMSVRGDIWKKNN